MTAWSSYRARRGNLPTMSRLNVVDASTEAVFPLGLTSGQGRIAWMPWDGDHPHCLAAGATGSGKSRLMESWALHPLIGGWDWDVEVLDGKGGGDYWAAVSNGAEVHSTPADIVAALGRAVEDIRRRSELMNATPIIRPREYDQVMVEDRAITFRDLPEEVRLAEGMRPRLIVIDELASVIGMVAPGTKAVRANKTKGIAARPAVPGVTGASLIFTIVQLARSAGIHLLLGIQRPDAKLIDGFVRHNVPSRILFGPANSDAEEMVLESAIQDHPERSLPRPTGTGFAVAIGGRQIVRFHADLLDRDRYLPLAGPDQVTPGSAAAPPAEGAPGPPGPVGAGPACPGAPVPASAVPPSRRFSVGAPVGGAPDAPPVAPQSAVSRFARVVRPVATGPAVRVALRLGSLRNLARPVVPGPFVRDPFLAVACKADAGYRCQACGAAGPVESDHRIPLAFGGIDSPANLQALCIRPHSGGCHGAKTAGEMRAWRLRTRGKVGVTLPAVSGALGLLRLAPAWVLIGLVLFLLGRVTGGWWGGYALAALAVLMFGPVVMRMIAMKIPLLSLVVRPRGPGLDGIQNWDGKLEELAGGRGFRGFFTRWWYGGRSGLAWTRIRLATASAVYIAGWQVTASPAIAAAMLGLLL